MPLGILNYVDFDFLKIEYALFLPFSKDMKNLGYRTTIYEVYYECILLKYPKAGNIQSVFLARKGKKMKNTIEQMELKNVRELVAQNK